MPESQTPYYATPKQPRLIWNNRDKRRVAEPLPSQTVEIIRPFYSEVVGKTKGEAVAQSSFDMQAESDAPLNRLIWTNDNLVALTSLLHGDAEHEPLEGKVDLVYIDPPFAVQSDFKINVEIEDGLTDEKLPTLIEELAYKDTWKDGLDSYLSMMRDRLELLKRLLAPTGSIYVHCDWHAGHYLKVMMDEVFGYENFVNEVVWRRTTAHGDAKQGARRYDILHDTVFFYVRSKEFYTWETQYIPFSDEQIKQQYNKLENGRAYRLVTPTAKKPGGDTSYEWQGVRPPQGRFWAYSRAKMQEMHDQGKLYYSESGQPYIKYYLDERPGVAAQSLWTDIMLSPTSLERINYPTQKPLALLQRIIAASSEANDLVLDCFSGSGTTSLAAETMKDAEGKPAPRRWIAIDNGKFAIHLTRKRLIEAGARPFSVENVGFYARQGEWRGSGAKASSPSAKLYRDAMVEVYGGAPVEGFTYLHGKKGARWVHVGPLSAPVGEALLECIAQEAAGTDVHTVDILSADIPLDFNKGEVEEKFGVTIHAKVIPLAAVDAVRERLSRKKRKDPNIEHAPDIHFFSPPDIEIRAEPSREDGVVVKLTRLTVDLDDCLSTQDAAKRAEIKRRITDWKALVDYWAVDWDYDGHTFRNQWQSFRTRKSKEIAPQAAYTYADPKGDKRIAVKVTDIFGNDGLKVIRVTL